MNSEGRLKNQLSRMMRVAKRLKVACEVAMVLFAIICTGALAVSIIGNLNSDSAFGNNVVQTLSLAITFVIGELIMYVFRQSFFDVSQGHPPFSERQAKILMLLGILLLFDVLLEAIISLFGLSSVVTATVGSNNIESLSGVTVLNVNCPMLFGSIACFCLSYLFKYGSLLQWLYDETI